MLVDICVPLSIAKGKRSAKYASTAVATAISNAIASIISTLLIWPKAYTRAAAP